MSSTWTINSNNVYDSLLFTVRKVHSFRGTSLQLNSAMLGFQWFWRVMISVVWSPLNEPMQNNNSWIGIVLCCRWTCLPLRTLKVVWRVTSASGTLSDRNRPGVKDSNVTCSYIRAVSLTTAPFVAIEVLEKTVLSDMQNYVTCISSIARLPIFSTTFASLWKMTLLRRQFLNQSI